MASPISDVISGGFRGAKTLLETLGKYINETIQTPCFKNPLVNLVPTAANIHFPANQQTVCVCVCMCVCSACVVCGCICYHINMIEHFINTIRVAMLTQPLYQ